MKTKTKVVVVGGGVVGVSALYHLAKKGWSDVVLIERKELTSGSTWHAAGLLPLFNMSYSVGQLHKYAVNLYKTLEEETGKNVGFSVVSNIRLASTKDRMDEYHQYAGVARTIGVDVKFLTPQQVKEIWPLCPQRKVRTSKGRTPGNAWEARAYGKCHRKYTAKIARVKRCGKSTPHN
jgi:dimethylglycine dehydrogenase